MEPSDTSEHSRAVALTLATLTGVFGGHRFYLGKIGSGIAMLCTFGGFGMWALIDWIVVLAGEFRDAEGKRVRRWGVDISDSRGVISSQQFEALLEEMDGLHSEMGDLNERVDFMERMLTEVRERERIPPRGITNIES